MNRYAAAHPNCIRERKPGSVIDRIVIHVMQGTLLGTKAWFQTGDREVMTAAHYLIGHNGDVIQMVPDANRCLHAGTYNHRSLGIELEGFVDRPDNFNDAMLEKAAFIVATLCKTHSIPINRTHIVGHNEVPGATHTDPGPHFPWDRFMALVQVGLAPLK